MAQSWFQRVRDSLRYHHYTLGTVDHFKINARISVFQNMTKYHQLILIPNFLLLYVRFAIYCQIYRADWLN